MRARKSWRADVACPFGGTLHNFGRLKSSVRGIDFVPRDFRENFMSSVTTSQEPKLQNYVNGAWRPSTTTEDVEVINPATAEVLTPPPLSTDPDLDPALQTPPEAFPPSRP